MSDASKAKDRKAFDTWMMEQFKHKRLLSVLDIEQIKISAHYTVRRLAYWVKKQGKMIAAECLNFFKSNGLIGKGEVQLSNQNFC
jgi:hypothetical protein